MEALPALSPFELPLTRPHKQQATYQTPAMSSLRALPPSPTTAATVAAAAVAAGQPLPAAAAAVLDGKAGAAADGAAAGGTAGPGSSFGLLSIPPSSSSSTGASGTGTSGAPLSPHSSLAVAQPLSPVSTRAPSKALTATQNRNALLGLLARASAASSSSASVASAGGHTESVGSASAARSGRSSVAAADSMRRATNESGAMDMTNGIVEEEDGVLGIDPATGLADFGSPPVRSYQRQSLRVSLPTPHHAGASAGAGAAAATDMPFTPALGGAGVGGGAGMVTAANSTRNVQSGGINSTLHTPFRTPLHHHTRALSSPVASPRAAGKGTAAPPAQPTPLGGGKGQPHPPPVNMAQTPETRQFQPQQPRQAGTSAAAATVATVPEVKATPPAPVAAAGSTGSAPAPPATSKAAAQAAARASAAAAAAVNAVTAAVAKDGTGPAVAVSDDEARAVLPPAYSLPAGYRIVRSTRVPVPAAIIGAGAGGSSGVDVTQHTQEAIRALHERIDVRQGMLRLLKLLSSDVRLKLEHDQTLLEAAADARERDKEDATYLTRAQDRVFRAQWNRDLKALTDPAGAAADGAAAATAAAAGRAPDRDGAETPLDRPHAAAAAVKPATAADVTNVAGAGASAAGAKAGSRARRRRTLQSVSALQSPSAAITSADVGPGGAPSPRRAGAGRKLATPRIQRMHARRATAQPAVLTAASAAASTGAAAAASGAVDTKTAPVNGASAAASAAATDPLAATAPAGLVGATPSPPTRRARSLERAGGGAGDDAHTATTGGGHITMPSASSSAGTGSTAAAAPPSAFKTMRNRMGYVPPAANTTAAAGPAGDTPTPPHTAPAGGRRKKSIHGASAQGSGGAGSGSHLPSASSVAGAAAAALAAVQQQLTGGAGATGSSATAGSAAAAAVAAGALSRLRQTGSRRNLSMSGGGAGGGGVGDRPGTSSSRASGMQPVRSMVSAEALYPHSAARASRLGGMVSRRGGRGGPKSGEAMDGSGGMTGFRLLASFKASVRCVCVVREQVWAVMRDGTVVVYQLHTAQPLHRITINGHVWCACGVRGRVWLGMDTGPVLIYDPNTFALLQAVRAHAGGVYTIVNTPFGVFSGSNDFTVHAWAHNEQSHGTTAAAATAPVPGGGNAPLVRVRAVYYGHSNGVRAIIAPTAHAVWSGSDDGSIRVWHNESGECVSELLGHTGSVLSLVCTGWAVWSCGEDGTIRSWSLSAPYMGLQSVSMDRLARVNRLLLVGRHVWSCGEDPRICVWDARNMSLVRTLSGHATFVHSLHRVKTVETRVVWSTSMGDDNVCVWQCSERDMGGIGSGGPMGSAGTAGGAAGTGGAGAANSALPLGATVGPGGPATEALHTFRDIDDTAELRALHLAEQGVLNEQLGAAEKAVAQHADTAQLTSDGAPVSGVVGSQFGGGPNSARAAERQMFSSELERLVMMLAEGEIRGHDNVSQYNAALQQNQLLRSELAALRGVVSVEREHNEQLSIALESKDDKLARLISDFELQLKAAYTQNDKTAAAAQRALSGAADTARARTDLEHELNASKRVQDELRRKATALEEDRGNALEVSKRQEQNLDSLRSTINSQQRLLQALQRDVDAAAVVKREMATQLTAVQNECAQLRTALASASADGEHAHALHRVARAECEGVAKQLQDALEAHKRSAQAASARVARVQSELTTVLGVNAQLRTVNSGVQSVMHQVSAIARRLSTIHGALETAQRSTTLFDIEGLSSFADRQRVWQLLSALHGEMARISALVRKLIARALPDTLKLHIGHTVKPDPAMAAPDADDETDDEGDEGDGDGDASGAAAAGAGEDMKRPERPSTTGAPVGGSGASPHKQHHAHTASATTFPPLRHANTSESTTKPSRQK